VEEATAEPDFGEGELIAALGWVRNRERPAPGREAVFAEWSFGHHIRYIARRPVLVNPFGTDLGGRAMKDAATIFLARDEAAVAGLLEERRIGTLLLADPVTEACFAHAFAPPGTPVAARVTRAWPRLYRVEVTPAYWDLVVTRLYFFDGMRRFESGTALGRYRLIYESVTPEKQSAGRPVFKLFEVVPGARVDAAAAPGAKVTARARVVTNQGRTIHWSTTVVADPTGRALLRLPYQTGRNGAVVASAYEVLVGERQTTVTVARSDVAEGRVVRVDVGKP
jgi:asparagine N-glycosylation enzyme membrane subunit Stt3